MHTHAHPSEPDRKFTHHGKHTLLTTNNCAIRHTKEKLICGYILKEKKINYFQNPENTICLSGNKVSMDAMPQSRGEGKK